MGRLKIVKKCVSMSNSQDNSDWSGPKNGSDDREQGPDGGVSGMNPGGVIESNWEKVCESFDEMNLKEKLLRGIYAYGFERPSAIQQRAILPCITGRRDRPGPVWYGQNGHVFRVAAPANRHVGQRMSGPGFGAHA